ncbi:unnamed protein product [Vitrella brassicaformis CCMP3155]|uniref:Pre-mRNA-processing factor 17 n=1 Tax=Vitrella brassicaformis (strain CCMP3155) TaxID=1169540 RepID=A0A0G4GDF2_VITBC|nr:unnamed protein product [Vitrella brassicaformis CCMP3155]|eukprot:CEM27201.1 unnamed protein product [Vitrella brassicaformis CCMP3155]
MDWLNDYGDEGEGKDNGRKEQPAAEEPSAAPAAAPAPSAPSLAVVNVAPDVDTHEEERVAMHDPNAKQIYTNPTAESLFAPLQGPVHPYKVDQLYAGHRNHLTGHLEAHNLPHFAFHREYHTFHSVGAAADPSDYSIPGKRRVGAMEEPTEGPTNIFEKAQRKDSRKRVKNSDPASDDYLGPWAPFVGEAERREELMREAEENKQTVAEIEAAAAASRRENLPEPPSESSDKGGERVTSIFHGKSERDYQGRSWIDPKGDQTIERSGDKANYIPKQCIYTYTGHTAGVNTVRFFPKTGHLMMSASMDTKIKIWDVYNQRKCIRTYTGHDKAVRDIQFTNDGRRFYSCSYDRNINLWDTETGKIIGTFTNGKTPYCVTIHPDDDKQNVFLIGSSDKKAVQFDADTGQITQEYNEHLGAVNTVTFVDDNNLLVTTSDDKKLFVWEFGIPVVVKHIAEPFMQSMPAVKVHPSKRYLACQSMDNQIVVYECVGRFRYQGRKRFKGHTNAGYGIQLDFSPDGRFITSGDINGKLWFWDWKTMKNYRTLKGHDGVCIGCAWHPTMTSRVATCGWDGLIKFWD